MHMKKTAGAGPVMQVIDILGNQRKTVAQKLLETDQRLVSGVGLNGSQVGSAHIVEVLHQGWIRRVGLGCRHILDLILVPETAAVAKGGDAALGADPGAGQDGEPAAVTESLEYLLRFVLHSGSLWSPRPRIKADI